MSCNRRMNTGTCSHYQCPFSEQTLHGYHCVDVIDGFCEVGKGCLPECSHAWAATDEETQRLAVKAFTDAFADMTSDWWNETDALSADRFRSEVNDRLRKERQS
jgi:hypothetical protein